MTENARVPKVMRRLAELTVDDIWQIADAGDQELGRLAYSSRRGTMELGGEDNDGLSQQACIALVTTEASGCLNYYFWSNPRTTGGMGHWAFSSGSAALIAIFSSYPMLRCPSGFMYFRFFSVAQACGM